MAPALATVGVAVITDRYVLCTGLGRVMPERVFLDTVRDAAGSVQDLADALAALASPAAAPYDQFTCVVADVADQPR